MSQTFQVSNEPCLRHKERYCYECAKPGLGISDHRATVATNGSSIEDSLVGRPTVVSTMVPTTPSPLVLHPVQTTVSTSAQTAVQAPTSPSDASATVLVEASKKYADATSAMEKALSVVADLEKRLEFARENVADAIKAKNESLEQIRRLIGEHKS